MKYLYLVLIVAAGLSCRNGIRGSGNIIKENRQFSEINALSVSGSVKVNLKNGEVPSLIIEADDNIMPYLVTNVSEKNLSIKIKGINNVRNATVNVYLVVPSISKVTTSASAEVRSDEIIKNSDKVSFNASSGSLINVNVDAPSVFADASSGADIILTGCSKNLTVEASSGSKVDLFALQAEAASASASSGSRISVYASVDVKANVSSGGSIRYKGGATSVVKNISSGGSLIKNKGIECFG